jgi:chromosome segregation ATPase
MPAYKQLYLDMKKENEDHKNAWEAAKLMIQIKRDLVKDKRDEIDGLKEEKKWEKNRADSMSKVIDMMKQEAIELKEKIDDLENTILHLESENEQLTESAVKYEIAFDKLKRSQSK